jgi:hypothetical protein
MLSGDGQNKALVAAFEQKLQNPFLYRNIAINWCAGGMFVGKRKAFSVKEPIFAASISIRSH